MIADVLLGKNVSVVELVLEVPQVRFLHYMPPHILLNPNTSCLGGWSQRPSGGGGPSHRVFDCVLPFQRGVDAHLGRYSAYHPVVTHAHKEYMSV